MTEIAERTDNGLVLGEVAPGVPRAQRAGVARWIARCLALERQPQCVLDNGAFNVLQSLALDWRAAAEPFIEGYARDGSAVRLWTACRALWSTHAQWTRKCWDGR